jgi:hypothetical protein
MKEMPRKAIDAPQPFQNPRGLAMDGEGIDVYFCNRPAYRRRQGADEPDAQGAAAWPIEHHMTAGERR